MAIMPKRQKTVSHFMRMATNDARSFDKKFIITPGAALKTASRLLADIDTPVSLGIALRVKYEEWDQLLDVDIKPGHYHDPFKFRDDYQAVHLLKKFDALPIKLDRQQAAFDKFKLVEEKMKVVNKRFSNLAVDPLYKGANVSLFSIMTQKISEVLKDDLTAEELFEEGGWGPGATRTVSGREVSAFNKFHSGNGITRDAFELVHEAFPHAYPGWTNELLCGDTTLALKHFQIFTGNKVSTVPKNSKIDRVIATEPDINMWFQRAIGKAIRRRLARHGIDLSDQSRNAWLSRLASLSQDLATVDFSSASDCIAKMLIRATFQGPVHTGSENLGRWFTLMDTFRSKYGNLQGQELEWEKFSSMGNGFTFELESLIFWAAAQAVCEYYSLDNSNVSVYGDDVILPSAGYHAYEEFCSFLGFTVNDEKSFHQGPFRESCGAHYFAGVDCQPFYIRSEYESSSCIYHMANGIRLLSHRRNGYYGCDVKFRDSWAHVVGKLPKPLRWKGELSAGDASFISNFDEAGPSRARGGVEGYLFWGRTSRASELTSFRTAMLVSQLFKLASDSKEMAERNFDHTARCITFIRGRDPTLGLRKWTKQVFRELFPEIDAGESSHNSYTLRVRKNQQKYQITELLVPQWYDLGPWF